MTASLENALNILLMAALPDLLGGASPPVRLVIERGNLVFDLFTSENAASSPRSDDHIDHFPFDPGQPPASFTLTRLPDASPRRVRLTSPAGDSLALHVDEVEWDRVDSRVFKLKLHPSRNLVGICGVQALYGVTAVYTRQVGIQHLSLHLGGAANVLDQAEALVLAVIALNRQSLVDQTAILYKNADYGAAVTVKSLKVIQTTAGGEGGRLIHCQAEVELKANRALRSDEDQRITHIQIQAALGEPQ